VSIKRFSTALLLFFITVFCLGAQTFHIVDFTYKIDGKTSEAAMDSLMGQPKPFESEEALKEALEAKKQELWNTNLFSKVEVRYTVDYSVDKDSYVTVNIEVDEAASSLFFPYPKYDSNYGFVMGLRFKERNLFGMMATMDAALDVKQQEKSFKTGDYCFDIPVSGIKLGNVKINADLFGDLDYLNKKNSYLGFDFDETGWNLGSATIASFLKSKVYYNDLNRSEISFSMSESGLKLGPGSVNSGVTVVVKPENVPVLNTLKFNLGYSGLPVGNNGAKVSFSTTNELYPKDVAMWFTSDSYNKFGVSFSGIKLGEGITVSESPSVTFQPRQNDDLAYRLYGIDNTLSFGFADGRIKGKSLTNTVEYVRFAGKGSAVIDNYIKTVTTFSFLMAQNFRDSVLLKTWKNDNRGLYEIDVDLRVEKTFSFLKNHLTLSPIVTLYNQFAMENGSNTSYKPSIEFAVSASASGGSINRISAEQVYFAFRDNFRYGMNYSMQAGARFVPRENLSENFGVFFRGQVKAFPLNNAFFNPSFRIAAVVTNSDRIWFDKTSDSDAWKVTSPVDSDYYYSFNSYSYEDLEFSKGGLNDRLRGILLANSRIQSGGFLSSCVFMGNINLTTAFLNFEDFGHTYINPFYDFALFIGKEGTELLHCVGFEGIAILDSHPLYPFRVSLGFNADDLYKKLNKEDVKVEYELFIGVGWYF